MDQHLNPKYLQYLALKYGLKPSRNYGQNFLMDESVIDKIIALSNVDGTDTVIEIGPGFGVLTRSLAARAGRVISFEIEKKLKPYWDETQKEFPNLEVNWGNVLKTFPGIAKDLPEHYKVVANLPYQITSAAIRMFLESPRPPAHLTLMVQKEVGERICAKPGDMSLLSVAVQYFAEPKLEIVVPSGSFWPPPKVDSAVISLKMNKIKKNVDEKRFFSLVKSGFTARRKLLMRNLQGFVKKDDKKELAGIFQKLGLKNTARAQELSVETWLKLLIEIDQLQKN